MSRSRRTVKHLALRAGIPPELALEFLIDAGIKVKRTKDVIPKNRVYPAEVALDLASAPKPKKIPASPQPAAQDSQPAAESSSFPDARSGKRKKKRPAELRVIGRRQHLVYLHYSDLELIHWKLVDDFRSSRDPIDPPGVRSEDLLRSALSRCETSLGPDLKYPTPPMAGAALLHSLVLNHAFHNGNKRTSLVSLLVFLDKNGWSLRAETDELFDLVISLARHQILDTPHGRAGQNADAEVATIAEWLRKHLHPYRTRKPKLKFHDLRSILLKHGCRLELARGGGQSLNIIRGDKRIQVWYGGEGRDVAPNTIPRIRAALELDEEHGYDSDLFYNAEERLPNFITKYRKTLEALAKT